jgi:glycosyltransferase involved in cell wall biosynthesis
MKIVRIIARLNVGGPAKHVVFLTEALQNEEFQSVLIAGSVPDGEEDMSFFALKHGVTPFVIQEMSRELSPKDVVSIAKLFSRIRAEKPDIIHTHTAKAGTLGRLAGFLYRWLTWRTLIGKPRKIRIVHTFHGHVFHSYYGKLKTTFFLLIERTLARFATDRIIVISPGQLKEISGDFGIARKDKFTVIPLGIDLDDLVWIPDDRASFRSELGISENETLVTFVGRLTEIKNIPLLFDAAALYKKTQQANGTRLRFAIVGDGHLRHELEQTVESLGINDLVIFAGNRRDLTRFYAGSDIVVLTSLNEGTPLTLIEAMAAERPVISTAVGGVVDLLGAPVEIREGFTVCERGIRVDTGQSKDLLEGLIYLAKNEKLRHEFTERARKFVESNYSRKRLVSDIKDLYRGLYAS